MPMTHGQGELPELWAAGVAEVEPEAALLGLEVGEFDVGELDVGGLEVGELGVVDAVAAGVFVVVAVVAVVAPAATPARVAVKRKVPEIG